MSDTEDRVGTLMSLLKRRGVILPAFEIHGGVSGLFDYGPVGGRMLRKVQEAWRSHWLSLGNIVEIDCPTIPPHSVLEAVAMSEHSTTTPRSVARVVPYFAATTCWRSTTLTQTHYLRNNSMRTYPNMV